MALSHGDLRNLVGCSRETVTRTLGEFRRKLIAIYGASIRIPFPEKLGRIAA
jgi:CRP-like cAMP-binding protein